MKCEFPYFVNNHISYIWIFSRNMLNSLNPLFRVYWTQLFITLEAEFLEFEPRRRTANNRFQLSVGSNLETLIKITSWTNHVWTASHVWTAAHVWTASHVWINIIEGTVGFLTNPLKLAFWNKLIFRKILSF